MDAPQPEASPFFTSSLSEAGSAPSNGKSAFAALRSTRKRLIPRHFDRGPPHKNVNYLAMQHENREDMRRKDFTGELSDPQYLISEGEVRPVSKGAPMAWKAPKIVEVPVGMEINMYACAARK
jgi:coenzyme PQQ precursor peptide PqqA